MKKKNLILAPVYPCIAAGTLRFLSLKCHSSILKQLQSRAFLIGLSFRVRLAVMKAGSGCCSLTFKNKEVQEEEEEVTAGCCSGGCFISIWWHFCTTKRTKNVSEGCSPRERCSHFTPECLQQKFSWTRPHCSPLGVVLWISERPSDGVLAQLTGYLLANRPCICWL